MSAEPVPFVNQPRCSNCAHWNRRSDVETHGRCARILDLASGEDAIGSGPGPLWAFFDALEDPLPHEQHLHTDPGFGCVLWEPK